MSDVETRSVRTAAVVLLVLSVARWGWSAVSQSAVSQGGEDVLEALLTETQRTQEEEQRRNEPLAEGERVDPNRADASTLDRLPGVGPAVAAAIVSARDSGVVFRGPGELVSVRGIGPALVERIRPWIDVSDPPSQRRARPRASTASPRLVPPARIDVNRASAAELEGLPGVGPVIAARIIVTRSTEPFRSVEDLARVSGIGPTMVERLRGLVIASGSR